MAGRNDSMPKNENHSSPQDCASCLRGCQWAGWRRAVYTQYVLAVHFIGRGHRSQGWRSSSVGPCRAGFIPDMSTVSSLHIHSFICVYSPSLIHPLRACQALCKALGDEVTRLQCPDGLRAQNLEEQ